MARMTSTSKPSYAFVSVFWKPKGGYAASMPTRMTLLLEGAEETGALPVPLPQPAARPSVRQDTMRRNHFKNRFIRTPPGKFPFIRLYVKRIMYVEGHEIVQAVRGFLIDEVQPVMIEKVGIAAPYEARAFLRIIVGIIVGRKLCRKAFITVPLVFPLQRAQVVLEVAENEDAAGFLVGNDIDAVVLGTGKSDQLGRGVDLGIIDRCVAGLRDEVPVVRSGWNGT